jgi:hypothetical protein
LTLPAYFPEAVGEAMDAKMETRAKTTVCLVCFVWFVRLDLFGLLVLLKLGICHFTD